MYCTKCNTEFLQIPAESIKYCFGCGNTEVLSKKLVPVFKAGKCAYKFENAELVTPFKYDPCDSPWMIMSKNTLVCLRGKYTLLDDNGNEMFPFQYDSIIEAGEGLYAVSNNGKFGYINSVGEIVIDLLYEHVGWFCNGLAPVCKGYKFGYINTNGDIVIPLQYEYAEEFEGNLANVQLDGLYGCINNMGEVVIAIELDEVISIRANKYVIVCDEGLWGCYSVSGKLLLPIEYDFIEDEGKNLIMARKTDGDELWLKVEDESVSVVDQSFFEDEEDEFDEKENIEVSKDYVFDEDNSFPKFYNNWNEDLTEKFCAEKIAELYRYDFQVLETAPNGLSLTEYRGKMGFIDNDCKVIIPFLYDYLSNANDGFIKAVFNGKYGIIDIDNQLIIPFIYNDIKYISERIFYVKQADKWGIVNAENKILVAIEYDEFDWREELGTFIAKRQNKFGLINYQGVELIPCIYDEVCKDGFAHDNGTCCFRKENMWYLIDRTNRIIRTNVAEQ